MGNDYARNIAAPDIDLASLHLYPLVRQHWIEELQSQVCPADLSSKGHQPLVPLRLPLLLPLLMQAHDAHIASCHKAVTYSGQR